MTAATNAVTEKIKAVAADALAGGTQQIPGMTEAFGAVIAAIEARSHGRQDLMETMAACRRAVGLPPAPPPPAPPKQQTATAVSAQISAPTAATNNQPK